MALDLYSKAIFTLIAVALAALAVGQFMPGPVVAQGSGCGTMEWDPCYVQGTEACSRVGLGLQNCLNVNVKTGG